MVVFKSNEQYFRRVYVWNCLDWSYTWCSLSSHISRKVLKFQLNIQIEELKKLFKIKIQTIRSCILFSGWDMSINCCVRHGINKTSKVS